MNNLKICFFIHTSSMGGAERSLLDMMKELSEQGVTCSIIMPGEGSLVDECLNLGIAVKSVDLIPSILWWCTSDSKDFRQSYKNIYHVMKNNLSEMIDFVKSVSADVIYTQTVVNPFGAVVAEKLNLPHIWALREYGEKDHNLKFLFGFEESMHVMYKASDVVVSISRSVAEVVLADESHNANVLVNYSNVDVPETYKNQKVPLFKDETAKIGIFGTVIDSKNQKDAVIACLKLLEDNYQIELYIVGHMNEKYYNILIEIINNSNFKNAFKFIEYIENPIEVMSQMDIILSCAKSEALGRTLFEAILLKKPIIYSNIGGPKEIYTDGVHGLAYVLYNTQDLADKIISTMDNLLETEKRVEHAYEYVLNKFNAKTYTQPILDALEQLTEKPIKREQKYVTEFITEQLIQKFSNMTNLLEKQLQEKEQQFEEQKQELQDHKQIIYDKEQHIQNQSMTIIHLENIAQSMRIQNRIKRVVKKVVTVKVWKILKYVRHNPSAVRLGLYTLKTQGLGSLLKKIEKVDYLPAYRVNNSYNYLEPVLTDDIKKEIDSFGYKPLVSIIMPVYNVDPKWLELAIKSIEKQWYENWELCISDDKSTNQKTIAFLKAIDNPKIKIKFLEKNQNISVASNEALKFASGDYIGLMDNDDELTPDALYEVVKAINTKDAEFIYSDEDKLEMDGTFSDPHFKPDFAPDMFLSQNYISHLGVIKKSLMNKVDGFTVGLEGAQDYDLYLKVFEHTDKVYHISKVLYHWRKIPGSTAADFDDKSYAQEAGKKALESSMQRRNIDAKVLNGKYPGTYKVEYLIKDNPLVSIVIPFKDKPELLKMCIESILEKSTYKNFEIIGISNNSEEESIFDEMKRLESLDKRIRFYEYNVPFNYSKINNYAVNQYAKGEYIILLNNDIEIITDEWIEELLIHSQREGVGCVGAKLYYPNDTIQHAGVVVGIGGIAGHSHKYFPKNTMGYFSRLEIVQNVSAVTAACLMVKKSIYQKVDGLNEENLKIAFNDVDFCLRVKEEGYLNIFTPYCEAYHHESISRGQEDNPEKIKRFNSEVAYMQKRHEHILQSGDPYYNKNLTLDREDFSYE